MTNEQTHFQTFWGEAILDTGWTAIPNLLSRNLKKLGITHAEFVLICNILSHKHDVHDPFPSQETLAKYQDVTTRQIRKLINSLRFKGFIRTGRRRNKITGEYIAGTAFSFKPLLDKLSAIAGQIIRERDFDVEIEWDDEVTPEEQEVPEAEEPEVPMAQEPEVPTKRKEKIKSKRTIDREGKAVASPSLAIAHLETQYQLLKKLADKVFSERIAMLHIDVDSIWDHWQKRFPQYDLTHIYAIMQATQEKSNPLRDDLSAIIISRLPHAAKTLIPMKARAIDIIAQLKRDNSEKTA
ncbi:helix-turn-helix domain-containing protein [Brevibacillus migulae]|uniref:helix-turn-helix domain-containing protein n=1 Tax=Brevibacillus migulae TaxID=1644114 RepID=UPI00106DE2B3|nr:helix-turn-helix domain-containing protein [Brevibacillus migulae]